MMSRKGLETSLNVTGRFKRFHFVLLLFLLLRVNTRHPSPLSHPFVGRRKEERREEKKKKKKVKERKGERKERKGKEKGRRVDMASTDP